MGQTEKRLEQLGVKLPQKDRRGKGVVPIKQVGNMVYLSAQIPVDESGAPLFTGKVGGELTVEQGYAAARQCAVQALGHITDLIGDLDRVECVVKVLGLVNSAGDFSSQPAVINGFSDLMVEVFGERGMHARSAMGAFALPHNAPVSVDCIFKLR